MNKDSDLHIRGSTEDGSETRRIFSKNLNRYMKMYGYSQRSLARELGTQASTVSQWCNGLFIPRAGTVEKLTRIFNCFKSDLLEDKSNVFYKSIPIYDPVSCGKGAFIDENVIDYTSLPSNWINTNGEYFANFAEGDSMEPMIHHGDLLIFEKADVVPVGRIGAFSLNGKYYCKRLKRFNDGSFWLYSDNEEYRPIEVKPEDDFRFLGFFKFKTCKMQ